MKLFLIILSFIFLFGCSRFKERGYLCKSVHDETITTSFLIKGDKGILKTLNLVKCGQKGNVEYFGETKSNCDSGNFPVYVEFDEIGRTLEYQYDLVYTKDRRFMNYTCEKTK